jgi:hypothetical protein
MKKMISLVLLLAVFGMSVASAAPPGWYARVVPNMQQASVDRPGLLGPWSQVVLSLFAPYLWSVQARYGAQSKNIPNPPVCSGACLRLPVQGIAR